MDARTDKAAALGGDLGAAVGRRGEAIEGDFRDWDGIEVWAANVAPKLRA